MEIETKKYLVYYIFNLLVKKIAVFEVKIKNTSRQVFKKEKDFIYYISIIFYISHFFIINLIKLKPILFNNKTAQKSYLTPFRAVSHL